MKTIKTACIVAMLFVVQLAFAQSKSDKMYDVFSAKGGVTNFSFSKNMLDAVHLDVDNDEGDKREVTGDLHQIRFMSYNPKKGDLSGPEFTKKAIALLPSDYKKYVDEENDSDTEIYLLGGKKKFTECHVFLTNEEDEQMRFVISFYGDFTVNDLEGLKKQSRGFSDED